MKQKKKLNLNDLSVESFVTSNNYMADQTPDIKGGMYNDDVIIESQVGGCSIRCASGVIKCTVPIRPVPRPVPLPPGTGTTATTIAAPETLATTWLTTTTVGIVLGSISGYFNCLGVGTIDCPSGKLVICPCKNLINQKHTG